MTPDDIAKARSTIAKAIGGTKVWGTIAGDTQDEVIPRIVENYTNNPGVRAHVVAVQDGDTPIDVHCLTMAITGNGPTSEANAKYIVCSFDPVAGWGAALDEVERLRALADAADRSIEAYDDQAAQAAKLMDQQGAEIDRMRALVISACDTLDALGQSADSEAIRIVAGSGSQPTGVTIAVSADRCEHAGVVGVACPCGDACVCRRRPVFRCDDPKASVP